MGWSLLNCFTVGLVTPGLFYGVIGHPWMVLRWDWSQMEVYGGNGHSWVVLRGDWSFLGV